MTIAMLDRIADCHDYVDLVREFPPTMIRSRSA
jgi:hypothetical protein